MPEAPKATGTEPKAAEPAPKATEPARPTRTTAHPPVRAPAPASTRQVTRRAAWLSTLVAVPLALVAGLIAFSVLSARTAAPTPATAGASGIVTSTDVVTMPAPALSARHATMCLAFIAQLPVQLRGLTQRHVSQGTQQNAAYGDPAITVECGAPVATVAPTDEIYPLSGVCWHAVQTPTSTIWTTLDREVPVAVTIPSAYEQPGQWTIEFSAPLVTAMPQIKTPYHC